MKILKIKLLILTFLCQASQLIIAQTFEPNTAVNAEIANKSADLEDLQNTINNEVDNLTGDVTESSGSLSYPNWVRFVQIARAIDSLNDIWNEAYGEALESIIQLAINENCTDVDNEDEEGKDLLAIIIEEGYLFFEEDIASVCFEEKFEITSLRMAILEAEDTWLDELDPEEEFNPGDSPRFTEVLYDEEYWPLINSSREYTVDDTDLTEEMLEEADVPPGDFADFIDAVKEVVEILGDIVNIANDLMDLFADCGGTTTIREENYKNGVPVPNEAAKIGYLIMQKGQLIDLDKTVTKIKGKAKLYKQKNNGKWKRDRKNRASIGFCAWEWNNCDDEDWLLSGPYVKPHIDGEKGGRAKIKHDEPKALDITETYHFLQFKFGKNGIYAGERKLLGNTGCSHQSNTIW